ncbi:MAG: bifunctional nuclease family protein [Pyrinomonadaceae bacterium]
MEIEVKIGALLLDPNSNSPIVVLKGVSTEKVLPIWVGPFEANAIASEIEKHESSRPMTHDLIRNMILTFGYTVDRITITELVDNTFYSVINLITEDGKKIALDSRPSDAIAIALRTDCPIFVNQDVFDLSNSPIEPPAVQEVEAIEDDTIQDSDEWADVIE